MKLGRLNYRMYRINLLYIYLLYESNQFGLYEKIEPYY